MRTSLLRQCKVWHTYRQPILSQRIIRPSIQQRTFHLRPSLRQDKTSDASAASASSTEQTQPEAQAESASQPASETSSKEPTPSPPKREPDPKDQELAELKVVPEMHHLITG